MNKLSEPNFNLNSFTGLLKHSYPKLYSYIFGTECITRAGCVRAFSEKYYKINDKSAKITYQELWNYIKDNEQLHTWWML